MVDPSSREGDRPPEERPSAFARDGVGACQLCGIEVDGMGVRRTTSAGLLGTKTELQILHNGETYRLTLTRFGKLLLQK
jgi:hypothetical protein